VKSHPYIALAFLICPMGCGGRQSSSNSVPTPTPTPPPTPTPTPVPAAASYVDCSAPSNGIGTQSSPWNTLTSVDATTFNPGDQIFFKRGMTCNGTLAPQGSGTTASPIVIDAYGTGPQPIIDGGMNLAAVQLTGQQGWEINNLEVVGGNNYGVNIAGTATNTAYTHFRLTNLNVHGAHYNSVSGNDSGEIFITIGNAGETFNDVVLDGVVAHDSHVYDGIYIDAGTYGTGPPLLGNNITVQNTTVYNIYGVGITLFVVANGLMQNDVAYNAGLCPPNSGCPGGSAGLMTLYCHTCIMQNNESYGNQTSNAYDGGDFDMDVWTNDNIVQYNYGHDSAGYCIAFFSADGVVGTNNIFRYNVCSDDSQLANIPDPGEIFLNTWNGGSLNGVQIYNNTFYWNPVTPGPAFSTTWASYSGANANFFKNNIIYSTVPFLIETTTDFALDNNIYWTVGTAPDWKINSVDYTALASYQSATGQDAHSLFADPMLNTPAYHAVGRPVSAFTLLPGSPAIGAGVNVCSSIVGTCSMGTQDFWGNPLPTSSGYNIGAWQ